MMLAPAPFPPSRRGSGVKHVFLSFPFPSRRGLALKHLFLSFPLHRWHTMDISATTASSVVFMLGAADIFDRDSIHLAAQALREEHFAQLQPPPTLAFPRDHQPFRGKIYWLVTFRFEPEQQEQAAAFAALCTLHWYPLGPHGPRGPPLSPSRRHWSVPVPA